MPSGDGTVAFAGTIANLCLKTPASLTCTRDLSNIGPGDFQISMNLTTTQTGLVAVANQRAQCTVATFWDIRIQNGAVLVETNDGPNYDRVLSGGAPVNNGLV